MLNGSIQIHSSVSIKIKSCNLTIQNFQIFMDDQCKYNTYTCYIYNQLQFIDHPKNTLSYSIFHNLKSIQICSQIQSSYVIQFSSVIQFSYVNQFNYINQFYVHQFSRLEILKIFRLSRNSTKFFWVTRFRETNLTAQSVSSSEI